MQWKIWIRCFCSLSYLKLCLFHVLFSPGSIFPFTLHCPYIYSDIYHLWLSVIHKNWMRLMHYATIFLCVPSPSWAHSVPDPKFPLGTVASCHGADCCHLMTMFVFPPAAPQHICPKSESALCSTCRVYFWSQIELHRAESPTQTKPFNCIDYSLMVEIQKRSNDQKSAIKQML